MKHTIEINMKNKDISRVEIIGSNKKWVASDASIRLLGKNITKIKLFINEEHYDFYTEDINIIEQDLIKIMEKHELVNNLVDFDIEGLFKIN
jgi:hypothetical protein